MKLVYISFDLVKPGVFLRPVRKGKGKEAVKVTISKPFYIGTYEVTQEQWNAVMLNEKDKVKPNQYPVIVTWDAAYRFLEKLREKNPDHLGHVYELPTEAQWELACRAGSATDYCYGNGVARLGDYAWFRTNSGNSTNFIGRPVCKPHPVGLKKANAWGLYDMHGNVWEWCRDMFADYPTANTENPEGPSKGAVNGFLTRVRRGGSCDDEADELRSFHRGSNQPKNHSILETHKTGFRIVYSVY